MRPVFRVKNPGAHTSIQDRGRFTYQHLGVPVSGAFDPYAFRVANLLVGNPGDAAVLEITFAGPQLEAPCEADIAITGADMRVSANTHPICCWQSVSIQPGSILVFGQAEKGCRAYLAVNGGFHVPTIMGSRSTYTAGKLGGLEGPSIQRYPGCSESIVSEPSIAGNVQIPPGGKPIILLVEQTIGGYAKIATVITPDLFKIARAKPGDTVRFYRVSLEEVHHAYRRWSAFMAFMNDIESAIQDF